MKKVLKPVYYCNHCKKHGLSASHITTHEKKCWSNPDNIRPCMDCIHLEETKVEYKKDTGMGFDVKMSAVSFKCKKLDKLIYHVKAEFKNLPQRFPETFIGQEPMPKKCEHQITHNDDFFENKFDF